MRPVHDHHVDIRWVLQPRLRSKAIGWFTESRYSHVGVMQHGEHTSWEYGARSDTVAPGYPPGVQYRPASYAAFSKMLILRLGVTVEQHEQFWQFLEAQEGKPYDWRAIAGMAIDRDWRKETSWFCSELVAAALEFATIIPKLTTYTWRITPGTLSVVCEAAGATVV